MIEVKYFEVGGDKWDIIADELQDIVTLRKWNELAGKWVWKGVPLDTAPIVNKQWTYEEWLLKLVSYVNKRLIQEYGEIGEVELKKVFDKVSWLLSNYLQVSGHTVSLKSGLPAWAKEKEDGKVIKV